MAHEKASRNTVSFFPAFYGTFYLSGHDPKKERKRWVRVYRSYRSQNDTCCPLQPRFLIAVIRDLLSLFLSQISDWHLCCHLCCHLTSSGENWPSEPGQTNSHLSPFKVLFGFSFCILVYVYEHLCLYACIDRSNYPSVLLSFSLRQLT